MLYKTLLVAFVAAASATCGTTGGGTATDCTGLYTCTDCGPSPCVDTDMHCWSCCGSDDNCYPYLCDGGDTCSTLPCASIEAAATKVPSKSSAEGKAQFAKAIGSTKQLATPVGARTSRAATLEKIL